MVPSVIEKMTVVSLVVYDIEFLFFDLFLVLFLLLFDSLIQLLLKTTTVKIVTFPLRISVIAIVI